LTAETGIAFMTPYVTGLAFVSGEGTAPNQQVFILRALRINEIGNLSAKRLDDAASLQADTPCHF
jgi:hypothetical protein